MVDQLEALPLTFLLIAVLYSSWVHLKKKGQHLGTSASLSAMAAAGASAHLFSIGFTVPGGVLAVFTALLALLGVSKYSRFG